MDGLKVYVAFGFHVNCYHSYRGDTNDKNGFASDLRIMRHTIAALDRFNQEGVPVKGTWDIENAYSLAKILPEYAPDIIESWKRRIQNNGDEDILMSYNNGAQSAQTHDEFKASILKAIHNEEGTGLEDVFGKVTRIIRPQEVMFNPYDCKIYQECGIDAICLYHALNSFDGFKLFVEPLSPQDSYNPLLFQYGENQIKVIPTISQMDLIDIGSLEYLVSDLHNKQLKGEIQRDCFVFINMDADSFFWEKMPLPKFLQKKKNFGGIEGLVDEIKNLDFVVFSTPGEYLKDHSCTNRIRFGEDVADGNFAGYASWAEKPFNRLVWTRLEKARALARARQEDGASPSFNDRVMLLSTTHFGLATPVLNITREEKALDLSSRVLEQERTREIQGDSIHLLPSTDSKYTSVLLHFKQGYLPKDETIKVQEFESYFQPYSFYDDNSVERGVLYLYSEDGLKETDLKIEKQPREDKELQVIKDNKLIVENREYELSSFIHYKEEIVHFGQYQLRKEKDYVVLEGEIHLPEEKEPGKYRFYLYQVPFLKGVALLANIDYPYTLENQQINSQASSLGRYTDNYWRECVPFQLTLPVSDRALIRKRNFRDEMTEFELDDFRKADEKNANRDSFNNALTGGILSIVDANKTLQITNLRLLSSSMAYMPMRLRREEEKYQLLLNPFGTYYGKQPHYISQGNEIGQMIYSAMAPQVTSLAPSYNGAKETFGLFFSVEMEEYILKGIADGSFISDSEEIQNDYDDHAFFHASMKSNTDAESLQKVPGGGIKLGGLVHLVRLYFKNQKRARKELKKIKKEWKMKQNIR